ncbi:MAG: saccharopine dehydrogenase NADP-binding domain-containing protein [Planctomycetes bacterium]|nr:saccharopine dehydrogenase NADP-binding domain-containing protein [Planctomycetota bacterium]
MTFSYTVLGAGRQGAALAYDLAKNGEASRIVLADADERVAHAAAKRLKKLLPKTRCEFVARRCDVSKATDACGAMRGSDVTLSAVPYRFNAELAARAVQAKSSFLDLGGNTNVVRAELALHAKAKKAGVSIVPDCGLAPGLGNHLAAHGVAVLDRAEHVHVRCGGLPEEPVGPLAYKLVFNFDGLINEYSGVGEFLRGGKRVDVPTLGEVEELDFGKLGVLEAAVTSGGTSTCPETWKGALKTYDYKTLRYPGHWDVIRALFGIGAFEHELVHGGREYEPRATLRALFESTLDFPRVRDIVLLRTIVIGKRKGKRVTLQYDVFERQDPKTGFTAMERGTAFPAALVAHFQARKLVAPGARPLEVSVPAVQYYEELPRHDIWVELRER